jgi:hypothetical protein
MPFKTFEEYQEYIEYRNYIYSQIKGEKSIHINRFQIYKEFKNGTPKENVLDNVMETNENKILSFKDFGLSL